MIQNSLLYKSAFYGFVLLFCTSCTQNTEKSTLRNEQTSTQVSVDTVTKTNKVLNTVEDIQKAYASVMKQFGDGTLDSTSFKYSCQEEKGGTVTYFSDKGKLRMVVHRYHEYDHYFAVDRYFVEDNKLYFAYLNGVSWSFEDGGGTRDNVTEQRIYVVNQQPVRCLEKKYVIRSNGIDNPLSETVPNKEVDCKAPASIIGPYRLLLKYQKNGTSGCL